MGASEDSEFTQAAELLLRLRLAKLCEALDGRVRAIEREASERGLSGQLARGLLVNACAALLDVQCKRDATDLLGLMRTFDALPAAEWLGESFDAHVDGIAGVLTRKLSTCSFGGGPSGSAEPKKMSNRASSIKVQVRSEIEAALQASRQRQQGEEGEPEEVELDDRLPLQRPGSFDQDLTELARPHQRQGQPLALTMIDLDHFKLVNDRHGHPVGDEVLLGVAEMVVKRLGQKGRAYRYGGEEFALLLPNYSAEEACGLAERIRKDIESAEISSKKLKLTASFGVAAVPDHAADGKTLLLEADQALYRAKHGGRNQVRVSGELQAEINEA